MVLPCSRFNRPIRAHILSMPNGSNPFAGSSKISTSVSPNKAVAISSRRFIPREKLLTLFFSSASSPTRLKTRGISQFSSSPPFRTSNPKIFSRAEGLVCSAGIWHIADTRPHQAQLFFRLASKEFHAPRRWLAEAQHYFNKRAFARPVCTNKGAKLRLIHLKGNVMQHTPFSIAL